MKLLKAMLRQRVDLLFGLVALVLLIWNFIKIHQFADMADKIFNLLRWTNQDTVIDSFKYYSDEVKDWQPAFFLGAVVLYVIYNVINKGMMIIKQENE